MISTISSTVPIPPGKCDKGVGSFEHLVLALMHVFGDNQLGKLAKRVFGGFLVHQEFRNNSGDFAARQT